MVTATRGTPPACAPDRAVRRRHRGRPDRGVAVRRAQSCAGAAHPGPGERQRRPGARVGNAGAADRRSRLPGRSAVARPHPDAAGEPGRGRRRQCPRDRGRDRRRRRHPDQPARRRRRHPDHADVRRWDDLGRQHRESAAAQRHRRAACEQSAGPARAGYARQSERACRSARTSSSSAIRSAWSAR